MDWQSMSGLREGMCQGIGKEDTVAIMPGLSRQEIFERQAGCHFVNPLTLALQEKRELVSVTWDSKGRSSAPGRKGLGGAVVAWGLPALLGNVPWVVAHPLGRFILLVLWFSNFSQEQHKIAF